MEDLQYQHVESALAQAMKVKRGGLGAFRARLRHLRYIGLPGIPGPGSGRHINYTRHQALELLIVAKLPFEVPSEPIVEARLEKLQREGKDGFMYYTVPEAVIRLRQGIGRLIRSTTDRGAALILDSRLASARYNDAFFESLPVPVGIFQSEEDTISEIKSFLNGSD